MNTNELLGVIKTLTETGYKHIDVSHEGSHILLSNAEVVQNSGTQAVNQQAVQVQPQVAQAAPITPAVPAQVVENLQQAQTSKVDEKPALDDIGGHLVESPIVGTFYASANPDSDAFVKVGQKVSKGDVLCIIEAMKLMNEIEADVDGEVVEVLVENEAGVEYGQALFRIV